MAFTIYEFSNVTQWGEPIQPAQVRTTSQATGTAVKLAAATMYVAVVPDADMHLRISDDGSAGTAADYALVAGETYGFPVRQGARPSLYGV
jgi:hypothetical protein